MRIQSRHSRRIVRTTRSALAFATGVRTGVRTTRTPSLAKISVEDAGELRITITDQDTGVVEDAADREVACLLGDPSTGRVRRDSRRVHAAGAVFDEEQDVESAEQDRVDAEEVAGEHAAGLGGEELTPGRTVSTRCGLQMGCEEDAADGAR